MPEFDFMNIKYSLNIDGTYYSTLDIEGFSHMMKDPSYCYKFYWLEAIVQLISEGVRETTFDDIIDEMICNAWYSVREFHIHLSGLSTNNEVWNFVKSGTYLRRNLWYPASTRWTILFHGHL